MAENIKVAVRVRPFSRPEYESHAECVVSMSGTTTTLLTSPPTKPFQFDYNYWSVDPEDPNYASQDMVMADLGSPFLDNALKGYNCCMFAYGQTGTGKSFSIMGFPQTPGVVPMVIEALFSQKEIFAQKDKLGQRSEELRIWVSFVELYNERLRDLLHPSLDVQDLKAVENPDLGVFIPGLTEAPCKELADVHKLMDFGTKKRVTASTNMNATSSRSHAIFGIRVQRLSGHRPAEGKRDDRKVFCSRLSLIDLAGSERVGRAGNADVPMRRDRCTINQSLSALGGVVKESLKLQEKNSKKNAKALRLKDAIPFHVSKLTLLLRDALIGNSRTYMLATISPASKDLLDTLSTLRFASNVKKLRTVPKHSASRRDDLLGSLQAEMKRLRRELETIPEENLTGRRTLLLEDIAERERLFTELRRPHAQQLEDARRLEAARDLLFKDKCLSEEGITEAEGIGENVPYLLNMNEDPALAGCIMYFLPARMQVTVGADPSNKIVIKGLGIPANLCCITNNVEEIVLTMALESNTHQTARVCVNGSALHPDERRVLKHNDKLFFGRSSALRLIVPEAARLLSKAESMAPEDVHEADPIRSLVVEDSRAWGELQLYLEDLWQRLGEDRGGELFSYLAEASHLVDEANEITAELRPNDRLKFEVELVWDIHRDAQDIIVIRLLEYRQNKPDGAAQDEGQAEASDFNTRVVTYWTLPKFKVRLDHMRDCFDQHLHLGGWRRSGDCLEDPWMEPCIVELRQRVRSNVDTEMQRRKLAKSPSPRVISSRSVLPLEPEARKDDNAKVTRASYVAPKMFSPDDKIKKRFADPSPPEAIAAPEKVASEVIEAPVDFAEARPTSSADSSRIPGCAVSKDELIATLQQQLKDKTDKEELYKLRIMSLQQQIGLYDQKIRQSSSSHLVAQPLPVSTAPSLPPQLAQAPQTSPALSSTLLAMPQELVLPVSVASSLQPQVAQAPQASPALGSTLLAMPQEVLPLPGSMLIPITRERDRSNSAGRMSLRDNTVLREASSSVVRDVSHERAVQRGVLLSPSRQLTRPLSPPSRIASPPRQLSVPQSLTMEISTSPTRQLSVPQHLSAERSHSPLRQLSVPKHLVPEHIASPPRQLSVPQQLGADRAASPRRHSWQLPMPTQLGITSPLRQISIPQQLGTERISSPRRQLSLPQQIGVDTTSRSGSRQASPSAKVSPAAQTRLASRIIRTASPVRASMAVSCATPMLQGSTSVLPGGSTLLPIGSLSNHGSYTMAVSASGAGSGRSRSDRERSREGPKTDPTPLVPPLALPRDGLLNTACNETCAPQLQPPAGSRLLPRVATRTVPLLTRLSEAPLQMDGSRPASLSSPAGQQSVLSPVSVVPITPGGPRMRYTTTSIAQPIQVASR